MIDEFLPVGSVVSLKEGKVRLIITGFLASQKENPNIYFDYIAAPYPTGIVDFDKIILFNHDKIDKVFFLGCHDEGARDFNQNLINLKKEILNKNNVDKLDETV